MNRRTLLKRLSLCATAFLAGCVTVGPDFEPVAIEPPSEWTHAQTMSQELPRPRRRRTFGGTLSTTRSSSSL